MRHLHESGASYTLCGIRRWGFKGKSVHVTKARKADCDACRKRRRGAGGLMVSDCGRCGLTVMPNERMVVYTHPDPASNARLVVHAVCIADEVAEGSLTRVSGIAYRTVAPIVIEEGEADV